MPGVAKDKDPLGDYKRPTMDFERDASIGRGAGAWTAVGIEFAIYVVLFVLGGKWLDGKFGWHPWGTAVGALIGVGIGMTQLIRRVMRASASDG